MYISAWGNVTSSVTLAAPMHEEYSLCQKNQSRVVACKARRFDQAVIKWNKTILILELVEEGDGGVKEECEDEELAPKTEAARG